MSLWDSLRNVAVSLKTLSPPGVVTRRRRRSVAAPLWVSRPVQAAAEYVMSSSFKQPVQDGLREIRIMQDLPECRQRFVGGHQDRTAFHVPHADDAKEYIGGIGGIALIGELNDH